MRNQTITIRAKPATSDYSSGKPLSYLGYVSTMAHTQTADTSMENMKEESNSAADKPHRRVKQSVVGVQIGTKLIPEVLKMAQIPVKNMKLESSFSSPGHQESINLQPVRYPDDIAMKSELYDDGGIVICSLDQSGEIEVEMACESPEPRTVTKEQFTSKTNKVYGCWGGSISGRTPIFENKSLENSTARKSAENAITTSKKPIRIENHLSLQVEAILQSETYTNHPNPRYKLVMVDLANQNRSTSQRNSLSSDKQYSSVSASKLDWGDRGVQVVKLIPNSIDVRPLKLENMKTVLSSKTTRGAREVDVSASLRTSGVQYGEELTETTGLQVAKNVDPNTTPDVDDSNFITILRVEEAQYSTGNKRTAGYWEVTETPNGESTFVQNRTHLVDKSVQVGLDLIPKTVNVDKVSIENMEVVSGQWQLRAGQYCSDAVFNADTI
nr:hypothetical protein HmN_000576600 [Hymenolepis microstoma]